MAQPTSTSSANGVAWNLKDLYDGVDDPQITRDLESALLRAQKFEKDYRGKIEMADAGTAGLRFAFASPAGGQESTLQEINAKLYDADRNVRRAAAEGLTKGLQANNRLLTFIFNTLVFDHQADCRLRSFEHFMAPRHLANEITDRVVEALMTATERHH